MSLTRRIILIAFLESVATIFLERGAYFFSSYDLGFSNLQNLWMAVLWGVIYVVGAGACHRLSRRLKEGVVLALVVVSQLIFHLGLMFGSMHAVMLVAGFGSLGLLNGLKWPLIESYVSAGKTPRQTASAIGKFNIAWASTIPLTLMVTGPILGLWPQGIFLLPAVINFVVLILLRPLPLRPVHLPDDHPHRPTANELPRLRALLLSSRWLMFFSYCVMFILAALMPDIFFKRLGFSEGVSPALSTVMDVVRLGSFIFLQRSSGWHGRVRPIVLSMIGMPLGLFMVLAGPNLAVVLTGEVIFGLASGLVYYAALYYAMLEKNASVDAGGIHEMLVGLGFAVGPLAALVGGFAQGQNGIVAGASLVCVVCTVAAVIPLLQTRRYHGA